MLARLAHVAHGSTIAWRPGREARLERRRCRLTTLEAMDLHVIGPLASPAERAAVDAVLGPGRVGLARRRPQPGDRGPRRPRRPRGAVAARPPDPGAPRGPVADRLDQPAGAELRLPAADGPAGRGLRRRHVLRPVRDDAAAADRRPRLRRHRLPARRRGGRLRRTSSGRSGPAGDAVRRRPDDLAAVAVPRAVRAGAGGDVHDRRAPSRRRRSPRRSTRPGSSAGCRVDPAMPRTASAPSRTSPPSGDRRPAGRRAAASGSSPASASSTRRRSTTTAPTAASGRSSARARSARDQVIDEVTASGLVGRGGAAFPTGRKWAAVAGQPAQPHYLVCNADESEPGTFKDRVLMEGDPFAVVEAMAIAAFAVGAEKAYLYIRGEYPLAEARIANAIAATRDGRARSATSTSSSGAAPAPTSAARRPPSSSRSRASAASRATSRRSRSRSGCSASRPPSTTSRRSSTCS